LAGIKKVNKLNYYNKYNIKIPYPSSSDKIIKKAEQYQTYKCAIEDVYKLLPKLAHKTIFNRGLGINTDKYNSKGWGVYYKALYQAGKVCHERYFKEKRQLDIPEVDNTVNTIYKAIVKQKKLL
jgi:hypothetical protein